MKSICGIYKIVNTANSKIYVGSSVNLTSRWANHKRLLREGKHHNPHLQNSWDVFGESSFVFTVIEECEKSSLLERENLWINTLNSMDNNIGYNLMSSDRHIISEETKQKIGKARTGKKHSEESKQKMSESQLESYRTMSTEVRSQFGKAWTGKKHSEETKQKMRTIAKGRTPSENNRNAVRLALTGKKHSEESKQKMRDAWIKRKTTLV